MKAGKFDFKSKNIEIIEIRLFDSENQEKIQSLIVTIQRKINKK